MTSEVRTALADCIRAFSREGRLFSPAELPAASRTGAGEWRALVDATQAEHPDLREIALPDGSGGLYSERFMTASYARILAGRGNPPALVVETVRVQSRSQTHPVPLSLFEGPPFDFSPADLAACLARIAEDPDTTDIARTITSAGTVFLYSTRHLQPDHAAALAEWIDVGQAENP
jgi:hypothetical protein